MCCFQGGGRLSVSIPAQQNMPYPWKCLVWEKNVPRIVCIWQIKAVLSTHQTLKSSGNFKPDDPAEQAVPASEGAL